ncbi:MAG: ferric uptake regulation protein [bacterium (Candidatus Ratteibacteria) CG_4_9_14_3_um_filter_41_21]|uniref:Ferric uptake regulation protein n=2 Tax=Candidatus Ratteibacteria TaxID=2979319 RepID=A0A2M7YGB4_9BACT|nr:MAG: ferric uptake regulation protein [bacterium (Candidatus Ratteibacteria) CG15_BIG_FIL_POST_REV_8_21_14_020_41_12]PJA62006.1 MAG: ferric uptake regulation protein [bacterium (Candidatus Ratteibacteria) CG_4_9_14_3_um_filter_41_21]
MPGPPWWYGKFQNAGHRVTLPRQIILGILSRTSKHLSAEEIYLSVHRTYPAVGLTTIYRTLQLLVHLGIVFKFDFGDGRSRYELTASQKQKHHHHLICRRCGRVIDYTDFIEEEREVFNKVEKILSQKYNFKINNHQVHFYGLCDKCQ